MQAGCAWQLLVEPRVQAMGQRWTALSASCASPCPAPRGRRQRGQRVIGETVASAISMDESRMWDPDFKASVGGHGPCSTCSLGVASVAVQAPAPAYPHYSAPDHVQVAAQYVMSPPIRSK